nr:polyphosphate kinase 1 [Halohasta salina]
MPSDDDSDTTTGQSEATATTADSDADEPGGSTAVDDTDGEGTEQANAPGDQRSTRTSTAMGSDDDHVASTERAADRGTEQPADNGVAAGDDDSAADGAEAAEASADDRSTTADTASAEPPTDGQSTTTDDQPADSDDQPVGSDVQPAGSDDTVPVDLSPSAWATDSPPRTPPIAVDSATDDQAGTDWSTLCADDEQDETDLSNPVAYLNRELSELSFQWRVLYEALDDRNPPLERLKFLAILTKNMDEFFMKRIGGLKQQIDAEVTDRTVDGRTPTEQWEAALEFARPIFETQSRCYHEAVRPALADNGIEIVDYDDLSATAVESLRTYFERAVLPTLTPLTFDPAHPFPFISNLSLSLAVLSVDDDGTEKFSRVKLPQNRPRLIPITEDDTVPIGSADEGVDHAETWRFVRLETVIAENIDLLFPNVEVLDCSTFRVTRNAEVRRNEEVAEGLIEMIEDVLRQRRFATVVRVEVAESMPEEVRSLLVDQLEITERELFELPEPLGFDDFFRLLELDADDLKLPAWEPQPHPRFVGLDSDRPDELFAEIAEKDILVHHPYHSFSQTVQTFLDTVAHDPQTLAIKVAIYRTAPDSQVVQSLIEAAKNGKQVAVMVELKARFDEENNLRWVKRLEEEGIHVTYGTIGLKTHSKVALAVREEDDTEGVRLYSHVATGNYHSETAKSYEDLGLFTDDRDIGQDLVRLFNSFTGHSQHENYRKLLVAPETLRDRLTDLIRREADHARAGNDGRIVAKMNALEDPEIVAELYAASQAGVDIDLVVRGICRLRPGIEGLSETIAVHSVVGRFLEHSRIFKFGNGGDPDYFIGSADWMTRNLDRRVEAVTPVETAALQDDLDRILDHLVADNRKRWEMDALGRYVQQRPDDGESIRTAHKQLMERVRSDAPEIPIEYETDTDDQRETSVDLDEIYLDEPFEP